MGVRFSAVIVACLLVALPGILLVAPIRAVELPDAMPPGPATWTPQGETIVIDHTCTDISQIPDYWLAQAKEHLIHYAHTSHGSQIVSGLFKLAEQDARYDFFELLAPPNHPPTELPSLCSAGQMCMYDGQPGYDGQGYEDYITPELYWATEDGMTRTEIVAGTGLYGYSMWSWCGQQSTNPTETVQQYLDTLYAWEQEYPGMRFILMTGHTDGGSPTLEANNALVREFATTHGMVLFDFADIETYAPDGNGPYVNDGEGTCQWCDEWCLAHPADCVDLPDSCAHTDYEYEQKLFCKLKANAFWWMMARLAGWESTPSGEPDLSPSTKQASAAAAGQGDTVDYTIRLENAGGPLTTTVYLTDVVPAALSYVPGSLSATGGTADDSEAPALHWSGLLSPSPAVTISYSAVVVDGQPGLVVNTAAMAAAGSTPITRSEALVINGRAVYLPLVYR